MEFKYVTFELNGEIFNSRDKGYTYSSPLANINKIIQEDIQKAVLVDGLYLLSGIIGATYLGPGRENSNLDVNPENFHEILNIQGSDGDFEIIKRGNRAYGWYLNELKFSNKNKINLHCKLFNILIKLFIKPEIQAGIESLFSKLMYSKTLYPADFQEVFDLIFTEMIKSELIDMLSVDSFGDIINLNYDKTSYKIQ